MKKKVIKKKVYTIEVKIYSDGTSNMKRTCDGFHFYELLGILDFTRDEILEQIKGTIKPDIIERRVIVDKK